MSISLSKEVLSPEFLPLLERVADVGNMAITITAKGVGIQKENSLAPIRCKKVDREEIVVAEAA